MKSKSPKVKRRPSGSKIFRLAVIAFAVYSGVSVIQLQAEVQGKRDDLQTLRLKCEEQRLVNKDLELKLSKGDDTDYIERTAREKLDYVYPYETVFINASGS